MSWRHSKETSAARGYGHKWRKARLLFLNENPLCKMCADDGDVTEATVVDHIIKHNGDDKLFWDRDNWQPLCKFHHDSSKQRIDILGYDTKVDASGWPVDPKHPVNRVGG